MGAGLGGAGGGGGGGGWVGCSRRQMRFGLWEGRGSCRSGSAGRQVPGRPADSTATRFRPMAMPTSAWASAGASLTPSPTIATASRIGRLDELAAVRRLRVGELPTLQSGARQTWVSKGSQVGKGREHDLQEVHDHLVEVAPILEDVPDVRSLVDIGSQNGLQALAMLPGGIGHRWARLVRECLEPRLRDGLVECDVQRTVPVARPRSTILADGRRSLVSEVVGPGAHLGAERVRGASDGIPFGTDRLNVHDLHPAIPVAPGGPGRP